MEEIYSHEKKKKLAERISKLKKKEDMVKILEIIYQDNKDITENQNGLFMFFHNLNNVTYCKIEAYLKSSTIKKSSEVDETASEKEYTPYDTNEFPDQDTLSPKLKYSNREKNIIKRQRYDIQLSDQKLDEKSDGKLDGKIYSDSDKNSESNKSK